MAFGNGAPDVFSAIAAIGNSKDGDSGLAFGALFGAGVFVSTVIVGVICFIQPFTSVQRPLLRDIIFFMISAFWAFYVVWDGKIVLVETLGFLAMYVVYIIVVIGGRFINQKIKLKKGIVTKNDFKAKVSTEGTNNRAYGVQDSYNGEDDRDSATTENDDEISEITRPLIENNNNDNDDLESNGRMVKTNYKKSLKQSCNPIDMTEWKESNILNKAIVIIKTPIFYVLKMTIPLVDYDLPNNNWNKVTIMINSFISPIFMSLATQIAGKKLVGIPVWSIALVLGIALAFLVFWFTNLKKAPSNHWVCYFFYLFKSIYLS